MQNLVQIDSDETIRQRLEAERERLKKQYGLSRPDHFQRPFERAFTAEERKQVTILFGGFTWKHEDLIRAVFQGTGYNCEKLPVPNVAAFQIGKEYGNNGQCNPTHSRSETWCSTCSFCNRPGFRGSRFWTNMSSLPLALAVLAGSVCMKLSIVSL